MNRITLLVFSVVLWVIVLGLHFVQVPTNQALAADNSGADDGGGVDAVEGMADDGSAPPPATSGRYLVTYVKSRTDAPRSATVITVINRSSAACEVKINWFEGFKPEAPVCTTTAIISSSVAHDFCSRELLTNITTCNSVCDPEATFVEGKARIFSSAGEACGLLGVDARVYYTTGESSDTGVAAVSNPAIIQGSAGNRGD